jgi:cobalt-zinc-cadmium efflux system outer membrane protein
MRHIWLFVTAAAFAGAAQAAPLTYEAALTLAAQSAPSLDARRLDTDGARAALIAAGRLPDPKLTLGVDNFPVSGPPAWRFGPESMTMTTIGVMQDMPNEDRRRAARQAATADLSVADAAARIELRTVRLSTALAWINLYYAERRLAALDEVDKALAPIRDAAPAQLASGTIRPAQSVEVEALTAALGDRRADLTAQVAKARAELARWTGDPQADVFGAPPALDIDPVALRSGLEQTPSLQAFDSLGQRAGADLAAAKADKRPDWSWGITYQHRDPMWGDMISVQTTISLPLFARTRQDPIVTARSLAVDRVRAEREVARRALAASLEADLADYALHQDRLTRAEATLVPLAKRRADMETTSYGAGTASLSDVLQAFLGLVEARIDALDRRADVARDRVRISITYGSEAQ